MRARNSSMERVLNCTGWARLLLMVIAGAGAALALAPFFWWPLLFISYGLLFIHLLNATSAKSAFMIAWGWGFGFFLVGMYWISIALLVDVGRYWWLFPISLLGLNAAFALFSAGSGLVFYWLRQSNGLLNLLVFCACLFASEWLRGHVLTGFPWNLIGYSWVVNDIARQIAFLLDIYSLSALTLLLATLPVLVLVCKSRWRYGAPVISAALIALIYLFGHQRLANAVVESSDVVVRVVQPNIEQTLKWSPEHAQTILNQLVELSRSESSQADIIIWPETAVPFTLQLGDGVTVPRFAELIEGKQTLITGMVSSQVVQGQKRLYNSMVAMDGNGQAQALYHKQHLVPFGEYLPLRQWLPFPKLTQGSIDFSSGDLPRVANIAKHSFVPLICYEVIFPHYSENESADWLLNITNDDWFGDSSGPYQHLVMAQFRATENGKPLIRAANSGISAVIDPYGRMIDHLALGERGVMELQMPFALKLN